MSLAVVIKGPEGVVLAADSRVSVTAAEPNNPVTVNFDNATKLLTFGKPHTKVAAVTYGMASIGNRTAHSFLPEFEASLPAKAAAVEEYANLLKDFYAARWKEAAPTDQGGPDMSFIVAGFDPGASYGRIFLLGIPSNPQPKAYYSGETEFGVRWGGQLEIVNRIVLGFDPRLPALLTKYLGVDQATLDQGFGRIAQDLEFAIPYGLLALQDCVDLAIFLIRATVTAQNLALTLRGVGGAIDVASITRTEGLHYVQRKQIHGEPPFHVYPARQESDSTTPPAP